MSGHLPSLDREALRKLRRLAQSMFGRHGAALPMRELVELAHEARIGTGAERRWGEGDTSVVGVTVDFEATRELGEPMIVVRVPERRERRSSTLDGLTPREREIADLIAQGQLNKQIAVRLGVTTATVKDHVHNMLEKTGLPNRAAIAAAVVDLA